MKINEEDKLRIIQLKKDGCSNAFICKKFGINISTICRIVSYYNTHKDESIKVKHTKSKYSIEFKMQLITMVAQGHSFKEVARIYNISDGVVYQWYKKYNELGYNSLKESKIGRPRKNMPKQPEENKSIITSKEVDSVELAKLRAENYYLKWRMNT